MLQVEITQDALQARMEATAEDVRAFARGYAASVETHCLSLLRRLEELRVQRRYVLQPGVTLRCYTQVLQPGVTLRCYSQVLQPGGTARWYSQVVQPGGTAR